MLTESGALRYWMSEKSADRLRRAFDDAFGGIEGRIVFFGSGDYHNLSYVWLSLVQEPVSVIHFDNHTDWARGLAGDVHLGSWVTDALKLPNVRKFIQLGIDGDLNQWNNAMNLPLLPIGTPSHDLSILHDGRLELYPTTMRRSTLIGRHAVRADFAQLTPTGLLTEAEWSTFRDAGGIDVLLKRVLPTLPTNAVYITIDKDALRDEDSFTNYYNGQQGNMTLDELVVALETIRAHKRIVAVDVCGDGSLPGVLMLSAKGAFHHLKDRAIPKNAFRDARLAELNATANKRIVEALGVPLAA